MNGSRSRPGASTAPSRHAVPAVRAQRHPHGGTSHQFPPPSAADTSPASSRVTAPRRRRTPPEHERLSSSCASAGDPASRRAPVEQVEDGLAARPRPPPRRLDGWFAGPSPRSSSRTVPELLALPVDPCAHVLRDIGAPLTARIAMEPRTGRAPDQQFLADDREIKVDKLNAGVATTTITEARATVRPAGCGSS